MQPARSLTLMPPSPDRGPLLSATVVCSLPELVCLHLKPRWVREHIRPRVQLSPQKFAWYKQDVLAWFANQRQAT